MKIAKLTAAVAIALALGGVALAPAVHAAPGLDPEERGRALFAERDRLDRGFVDQSVGLSMTLRDPDGGGASRALSLTEVEGTERGADRSLIVFASPPDISGTALLTQETEGAGADRQWIYTPAEKRTRRIAGGGRGGRFVGTEFSYEDLSQERVEDFSYRWIRDEPVDGRPAHLVERVPTDPESAYARQETWVDAATKQVLKAHLFDRKGRHVKTLVTGDWRQYRGRFWRPHRLRMTHLPSGRSTEILASEYRFGTGLSPAVFEPTALGR